ncbi:MAG: hypothetical protein ACI30M_06875 [Muribaculaceae bacterium]
MKDGDEREWGTSHWQEIKNTYFMQNVGTANIYILDDIILLNVITVGDDKVHSYTKNAAGVNKPRIYIYNKSGRDVTIKAGDALTRFFDIWENAVVRIFGDPDKLGVKLTLDANGGTTYEMIRTSGYLELEDVILRNHTNKPATSLSTTYPAIRIGVNGYDEDKDGKPTKYRNQGYTTLTNCIIEDIITNTGSAIYARSYPGNNSSNTPNGCRIVLKNTIVRNCQALGEDSGKGDIASGAAGIIRTNGQWPGNMTLDHVEIYNNYAEKTGAGVFWNAFGNGGMGGSNIPTLTLNGCKIYNNKAMRSSAAIHIEANCKFEGDTTEIFGNYAQYMGAGIHIHGYAGIELEDVTDFKYNLGALKVHDNVSDHGAGLAFLVNSGCKLVDGSELSVNLNGARFYNNIARAKGGAMYFENRATKNYIFNLYLNRGDISHNQANANGSLVENASGNTIADNFQYNITLDKSFKNEDGTVDYGKDIKPSGAAIYAKNTYITYIPGSDNKVTMCDNKASFNGGAIYLADGSTIKMRDVVANRNSAMYGGAIFSDKSNLIIGKAEFDNNVAGYSGWYEGTGGAINMIGSGDIQISDEAVFTNNKASYAGGAILMRTADSGTITGSIKNAKFTGNMAVNGGAAAIDGTSQTDISLDLIENSMENNAAFIGGGLLLSDGTVNYYGGLIRNNVANAKTGNTIFTAKNANLWLPYNHENRLSGFGGGIALGDNGKIYISNRNKENDAYTSFGIYGNTAAVGGNDIFSNGGSGSWINLPDVKDENFNMEDYKVPVSQSAMNWMEDFNKDDTNYPGTASPHDRYAKMLGDANGRKLLPKIIVSSGDKSAQYLNLTLGYSFVFISVKKEGLKPGESAIFDIYQKNEDNSYKKYLTMLLTGKSDATDVSRLVALTAGTWKVEETSWSWTYSDATPADKVHEVTLTGDETEITEVYFKNTKEKKAPHAEGSKANTFSN